jgi:hypothetical protein
MQEIAFSVSPFLVKHPIRINFFAHIGMCDNQILVRSLNGLLFKIPITFVGFILKFKPFEHLKINLLYHILVIKFRLNPVTRAVQRDFESLISICRGP